MLVPLFILLLGTGCSTKTMRPADQQKSCEALNYEAKLIKASLKETPENETAAIHYVVIGGGVALSLTPALLLGKYFYGVPALTIAYYNFFVADNQEAEHQQLLRQRLDMVKILLENKKCTDKGNH